MFANEIMGHNYTDTIFLSTNTLMYMRNALDVVFLYISVRGFRRDMRNLILKCLGRRPIQVRPTTNGFTRENLATVTKMRGPTGIVNTGVPRNPH